MHVLHQHARSFLRKWYLREHSTARGELRKRGRLSQLKSLSQRQRAVQIRVSQPIEVAVFQQTAVEVPVCYTSSGFEYLVFVPFAQSLRG